MRSKRNHKKECLKKDKSSSELISLHHNKSFFRSVSASNHMKLGPEQGVLFEMHFVSNEEIIRQKRNKQKAGCKLWGNRETFVDFACARD